MTDAVRYPVVELRQYTLRPGQRDVLIDLFDRELVESQEAEGMAIVGQFRDLDDPDRFVWIRGFGSMPARARALAAFYGGPVWKANSAAANATMIDSDNVLLLRPVTARSGFPALTAARLPVRAASAEPSRVMVTLYYRDQPFDQAFSDFFDRQTRPALIEAGATPLACLQTEHAENTFPALPVRTGENVFAWFARFPGQDQLDAYLRQAGPAGAQQLRLAPTARSLLR
ncbi:MAG TPA: NIPSNAP family protein [Streptosporangiaceae bacterium]|nr:NIPSNAP family protein [Streptosporangiaceae bacterium]